MTKLFVCHNPIIFADYIPMHPAPVAGDVALVTRRGAGSGGRVRRCRRIVMRGGPSRGIPPGSRSGHQRWIATLSPPGANTEQAFKHRARNAGIFRQSVATLLVWFLQNHHTGPWAGQKPGVPRAPVLPGFGNGRKLDYGAPGAAKNTGDGVRLAHRARTTRDATRDAGGLFEICIPVSSSLPLREGSTRSAGAG